MAIPPKAFKWTQEMDPADQIEYVAELAGDDGLLETGEGIASYTLELTAEAVALGLTIGTLDYAVSNPTATSFRIWFTIDALLQDDAAFAGAGTPLAMELTIVTDRTPPRTRQRTLVVQVAQQ